MDKRIPREIEKKIRNYIKILREDGLPIKKVVLFGSWAKKRQTRYSDIDLCIVSSRFGKDLDPWEYLWKKRIILDDYTIEPVGFSPDDFKDEEPLVSQIKKTGIELTV